MTRSGLPLSAQWGAIWGYVDRFVRCRFGNTVIRKSLQLQVFALTLDPRKRLVLVFGCESSQGSLSDR